MIWIIGSSSTYSKNVIKQTKQSSDVLVFGRHNLDYGNFSINQYDIPKKVFLNINFEDSNTRDNNVSKETWIKGITGYSEILHWKKSLYDYLSTSQIPVTVCDVTSSITKWPHFHFEQQQYSIFRAMQQTLAKSYQTNINIFGVCPNGISDQNAYNYAKMTVELLNSNHKEYTIYNLAKGGSKI